MMLLKNQITAVWQNRLLAILVVLTTSCVSEAGQLTDQETDGYLQWKFSLEETVKARQSAGAEEGRLLFPFDLPGWQQAEVKPYRHLAISKAIMELEAQWLLRGQDQEESALVALAHARNYTNLSEYDSAMVWYQAAARLDTLSLFRREIGQEQMAVTEAAGDSLGMIQLITNTLGATDLADRDREIILAFRWLLTGRDSKTLGLLLERIESQPEIITDQMVYWQACSLAWLDRSEESLAKLRKLIVSGGLSKGLSESQRAWVLQAVPDQLFLLGDTVQSRALYESLLDSNIDPLRLWSTYQIANLDFMVNKFEKAVNGYDTVCEARRISSWQEQACQLATLARELERIRNEGEAYGTANFYSP